MQRRAKTLQFEMVLSDKGFWQSSQFDAGMKPAAEKVGKPRRESLNGSGLSKLDSFSRLLSARNVHLLKLIKDHEPQSIAELARLSGRPKASLMLTLKRFEKFGIVDFVQTAGARKIPVVVCDRLRIEIPIG